MITLIDRSIVSRCGGCDSDNVHSRKSGVWFQMWTVLGYSYENIASCVHVISRINVIWEALYPAIGLENYHMNITETFTS